MGRICTKPGNIVSPKPCADNSFRQYGNPYQQYRQNAINTASPQELTLMLYNGLVRFLKLAYQGIEEKNVEKANNNIIKSQNILIEFMSTLDMQYEISEELFLLYEYMNRRLLEANFKKDLTIIEEVTGYAEELRDTWEKAVKLAKQQDAVR
ncbi:MAG: flagellar export chaperone FliS [Gracilibacteraceae bacterium]|jgi:flagellar protein FliS|nr:flagellar export chaperone FliS [Gracilibacteraceae bacterium]